MDFETQNQDKDEIAEKNNKRRMETEFKQTCGFELKSTENLLPAEITVAIFSRLPAESVLECKRVCKTWRTLLLCDTHFPYMHLERHRQLLQQRDDQYHNHNASSSIINGGVGAKVGLGFGLLFSFRLSGIDDGSKLVRLYYGEIDENNIDEQFCYKKLKKINHCPILAPNLYLMVGSCNGLFCYTQPHYPLEDLFYISNPINKECVELQSLNPIGTKKYTRISHMVCGFGYHPSTNEYKVVRIYFCVDQPFGQVQVYTLGSGSGWRNRGKSPWSLLSSDHGNSYPPPSLPGILANGALHWLINKDGNIVAFDLADEEFHVVTPPPCLLPAGYKHDYLFQLRELGGCLCVTHQQRGECVDIWSLKKMEYSTSYRMEEEDYQTWTWSREFSIRWRGNSNQMYEPMALTKRGEVLLWHNKKILTRYDPKTRTSIKVMDLGDMDLGHFEAIPHMNSFVSLRAIGEMCTQRTYMLER